MSVTKFISSSILLLMDQLVVAGGGWFYWLIISKLISTSELGQATTVFSVVTFITICTELGLEYPILKKASSQSPILGTTLVIQLASTLVSIPVIIYFFNGLSQELHGYLWIAIVMLFFHPSVFVCRYVLLGISDVKKVFLTDTTGVLLKFVSGYVLVAMGFGVYGVLDSFLISYLFVVVVTLVFALKRSGFGVGNMRFIIDIIREGLINWPYKLSLNVIIYLSIVLLALFGITDSEIGVFYIALTISLNAGSFVSSTGYMVLPASSISKKDLSSSSLRIGISLTAPLISALIVSPAAILSMIGAKYVSGETILLVLSIGILPFSITFNTISKFNYLGNSIRLLSIGSCTGYLTFIVAFLLLVPHYGTVGAALSILIAFSASSIPSIIWLDRTSIRYIAVCGVL